MNIRTSASKDGTSVAAMLLTATKENHWYKTGSESRAITVAYSLVSFGFYILPASSPCLTRSAQDIMLRLSKTFAALVITVPFVAAQSAVWGQVSLSTYYCSL